ncbi:hypothetical protein BpHYR1_050048 [Brachionus plicatilis]|uniref:Uncharacterized protein n=1 Tax=Brachionus plicatilis TaxID=10195 RepID=A0A3M7S410_BRAPC|nr:hypothetical protein BpHYR1_050048 [Brachionus plicatilis]
MDFELLYFKTILSLERSAFLKTVHRRPTDGLKVGHIKYVKLRYRSLAFYASINFLNIRTNLKLLDVLLKFCSNDKSCSKTIDLSLFCFLIKKCLNFMSSNKINFEFFNFTPQFYKLIPKEI